MRLAQYGRRVSEFCSRTSVHSFLLAILLLSSTTGAQSQQWITQPSDRNVTVGGNVTFRCEAEGVDSLTHIWNKGVNPIFLNGVPGSNVPSRYKIQGKNNLVISGVTLEDDSFYSCTIFNFDSVQVKLSVQLPPGPPSISVNSSSSVLVEKSVIQLTCSSRGGKPAPTFNWLRNGQLVNSAIYTPPPSGDPMGTSSSLITVTLNREDHKANFSCVVFNAANQKTPYISTKILEVQYSPSIQIAPAYSPYYVKQGSNVKLTCNVDANPRHNFLEWRKDGSIVARNVDVLTLNSIQKGSSGNYSCLASNSISGDRHSSSSYKIVDVIYAPIVTTESLLVTNVSTNVNMTCRVDANPPALSVTWQKLDSSISYPGPSFTFIASLRYDGNYSCKAISRLEPSGLSYEDVLSKGYTTVKVQYPPGQASISPIKAVLVGQPIILTCTVDKPGYPLPKYVWRRAGNPTPLQASSSPIYRVNTATLADNGNYSCTPGNIMGDGSPAEIDVEVNSSPVFVQSTPAKDRVEVSIDDTNMLLEHKIEGRPRPLVEWLKDGLPITGQMSFYHVETTSIVVEQYKYKVTTRLIFQGSGRDHTKLRIEDTGNYTCIVTSTATPATTERTTALSIHFKPAIIEHPRVAANLTEDSKLRCIIQGNPRPTTTWHKSGNLLPNGAKYPQRQVKVTGIEMYEAEMTIRQIVPADFGEYTCQSQNSKGSVTIPVTLSPRGKPDKPTNLASVVKTWESIKLKWDAGFDGGYIQSFFISVRSVFGERIYEVLPSSATEYNVSKLMPHTSYTFRVFGQNRAGQGRNSDGFTAQTEVLVFPPLKEIPQYRVEESQIRVPNELNHSYCLRLDVSSDHGKVWNAVEPCVMAAEGVVPLGTQGATNINVSVCLVYRPEVCGEPVVSVIHEGSEPDLTQKDVIIIGLSCAAILIILLVILIVIICRRQRRKNNFTHDPHSPRTVQQGNGALPNQKSRGFDNPGMGRVEMSHGSHSNMGTLTRTNNVPNGGSNMPDIAVNNISYGVPALDNRNGYPTQYLHYGENSFPLEDTSYDSHTFDKYEYEMNRRNANISDPYYEKQQQGDMNFSGSPRTPTKDPQQFINVPEDSKNEGGSYGSGHESGYSTPDPAKPKKVWRLRPNFFHLPHLHPGKSKDKGQKTNPDMVPYSHDPPGHTCGLPCCSEDLQIQLRVRRQPRSCIGIQEHDVIAQNFTFKGRLRNKPSLENGFYSVQQQKEMRRGDIPVFGSLRNQLPTIKEEKKSYNFLKGRGITLPELKDPGAAEKVYLQGFCVGESDDIFDAESESEIEYYMTFKRPSDPCRGVPYEHQGADVEAGMLYPWELLKEIKEKAKSNDRGEDSSSSNYYEVLRYPEEQPHLQRPDQKINRNPFIDAAVRPAHLQPPGHLTPPDIPPRPPRQNMFNHPPLPKDINDTNRPKPDTEEVKFPNLEQTSKAPTKYNTYNSVHSINNMANKLSRDAYEKYLSISRLEQTSKPFHRDFRDIDFSGLDNPTRAKPREFRGTLERILQRNDNSTDSLDKDADNEIYKNQSIISSLSNETMIVKPDKESLIEEDDEEDDEGFTNVGFKNVRIDGKILGSRNSIISDHGSDIDGVYHGSLSGDVDGNKLSEVINAAGVTDAGLKYFHIDDIDNDREIQKGSLSDNPITLIL